MENITKFDALLVLPPMYHSGRIPDYNPKEPMGLMYLSSALRKAGLKTKILDADIMALTIDETVEEIRVDPSRIIGISVMQRALPSVKLLVEKIRERSIDSHLCCGGFTATLSAKHILEKIPQIDSIVLGEGENTFPELVKSLINNREWRGISGTAYKGEKGIVINLPAEKPEFACLEWPSRDLLEYCLGKTNYATILGSRGCYGVCTFCSNQSFERSSIGANWRGRNPEDIVDELEHLKNEHRINVFKFNDPNMFGPGKSGKQHVIDICTQIIKRKLAPLHIMGFCRSNDISLETAKLMRFAGFERMLIGIESVNPEIIKVFKKGESLETIYQSIDIFRQVDIDIVPGFMIFNPYTTLDTLKVDLAFLEKYRFTPTLSKALRVFDGTPIQEILDNQDRLIWQSPFEGYHEYLVDSNVAAIYMSLKIVFVEWIDLLRKTYQNELWEIKKAYNFKERKAFDNLSMMIFSIEKEMLKVLISWIEKGFAFGDIYNQLEKVKSLLMNVENYIAKSVGENNLLLDVGKFSIQYIAEKIHSILLNKIHITFPEKYRWKDD